MSLNDYDEDPVFAGEEVLPSGQIVKWQSTIPSAAYWYTNPAWLAAQKLKECLRISIEHKERDSSKQSKPTLTYRKDMSVEELDAYYNYVLERDLPKLSPWV